MKKNCLVCGGTYRCVNKQQEKTRKYCSRHCFFVDKSKKQTKHGLYGTRFYRIFFKIRERCNDKRHPKFHLYGGRGITTGWIKFEQYKLDMYEAYEEHVKKNGEHNTTIDRINRDKGYNKHNCRWATYSAQNKNRRMTKKWRASLRKSVLKRTRDALGRFYS